MQVGVYIRGLTSKNNPYEMADKLIENGIDFVTFMIYWQTKEKDKKINSNYLADYVKIFDAHGISCSVWGYPWCGKEQAFIDRFEWAINECDGRLESLDIDPERGYQGFVVGRNKAKEGAKKLVNGLLDIMDENLDMKCTSFGAAHIHRTFPWKEFCCGIGSPQFYLEDNDRKITLGLKKWKETGWIEIMPSVPAFGKNSGKNIQRYIENIKKIGDNLNIPITGWIFWSYHQINNQEWKLIKTL